MRSTLFGVSLRPLVDFNRCGVGASAGGDVNSKGADLELPAADVFLSRLVPNQMIFGIV